MSARTRLAGGGVLAALLVLALLGGAASPGFSVMSASGAVAGAVARVLRPPWHHATAVPPLAPGPTIQASEFALEDIPGGYLGLYVRAARTCPQLSWQLLAGIGKVETNHGRSGAPGVRSGVNSFGCCSGPMQFNIRNGPPSTWDSYGDGTPAHVYDPRYAIPAAAHKLCADGLANPHPPPSDPCPTVTGTPTQHQAIKRYNNACWYVHQVLTLASRYTTTPAPPPASDPFVIALAHNPHLHTTTSHGCQPAPDLASGRLDLRVQSLLAVLADHFQLRISCLHSGHSRYVAGTHRISNHTLWRAVDIDQVNGQPVGPQSPAAHALVTWLDRLQGPLRPSEIGSPFPISHQPYFSNEDHHHHIHIGYSPM
jgi:hypothetical protein